MDLACAQLYDSEADAELANHFASDQVLDTKFCRKYGDVARRIFQVEEVNITYTSIKFSKEARRQKAETKPLNLGIIIRFRNSQSPQTWPGLVGTYATSSFLTLRLLKFCQQHLSSSRLPNCWRFRNSPPRQTLNDSIQPEIPGGQDTFGYRQN